MAQAIYTFARTEVLVLIPKRRGTGYCKSVFGGHHSNQAHKDFMNIAPRWFVDDTCDVDGHLSIGLKIRTWDDNFADGLKQTFDALKTIFPHIDGFIKDDKAFWAIVIPS